VVIINPSRSNMGRPVVLRLDLLGVLSSITGGFVVKDVGVPPNIHNTWHAPVKPSKNYRFFNLLNKLRSTYSYY
jgi:hypothetical protein